MSGDLYWQVEGSGQDIIFLHGWGMNGAVWETALEPLKSTYRIHIVDLPGYGFSATDGHHSLESIAQSLVKKAPKEAIWVGWSLGGLVASYMALHYPEFVKKLVTVSSSPKFAAEGQWRGIQPAVLNDFTAQLMNDFQLTIERFMALQAMGSPTARKDVKQLKQAVLSRPHPEQGTLLSGLKLLADIDLREQLSSLSVPFLRLYGRLDGLVPVKVAGVLDKALPNSHSHVFRQSSHAPFITEPDAFCQVLEAFISE